MNLLRRFGCKYLLSLCLLLGSAALVCAQEAPQLLAEAAPVRLEVPNGQPVGAWRNGVSWSLGKKVVLADGTLLSIEQEIFEFGLVPTSQIKISTRDKPIIRPGVIEQGTDHYNKNYEVHYFLRLRDGRDGHLLQTLLEQKCREIDNLTLSSDGKTFAVVLGGPFSRGPYTHSPCLDENEFSEVAVWDAASLSEKWRQRYDSKNVGVKFNIAGDWLLIFIGSFSPSGVRIREMEVREQQTSKLRFTSASVTPPEGEIYSVFSAEPLADPQKVLLSLSVYSKENSYFQPNSHIFQVLDLQRGKVLQPFREKDPDGSSSTFRLAPDNKTLIAFAQPTKAAGLPPRRTASLDQTYQVNLWNLVTSATPRSVVLENSKPEKAWSRDYHSWQGWIFSSHETRILAPNGGQQRVRYWDVRTGKQIPAPKPPVPTVAPEVWLNYESGGISFNHITAWPSRLTNTTPVTTTHIAIAGDGEVVIWNLKRGQIDIFSAFVGQQVTSLEFSPDGQFLAVGGGRDVEGKTRGAVKLWNVTQRRVERVMGPLPRIVTGIGWVNDGKTLACSTGNALSNEGDITLWNIASGRFERTLYQSEFSISALSAAPDGRSLLILQNVLNWPRVIDVATGEVRFVIKDGPPNAYGDREESLWTRNGEFSAHINRNKLWIWNANNGEVVRSLQSATGWDDSYLRRIALSDDGRFAVASTFQSDLPLWDATEEAQHVLPANHEGAIYNFIFLPNSHLLAVVNGNGTVTIWDAETRQQRLTLNFWRDVPNATNKVARPQWLAHTPQGFFTASPAIESQLLWFQDGKEIPQTEALTRFRQPEIIANALH